MNIVLVEDDDAVRNFVEACLVDANHSVLSFGTVEGALCALDVGTCPDLLVTDYNLRDGRNGVELAERVRAVCCDVPVLVITGRPDLAWREPDRLRSIKILAKPFSVAALLGAVDATQ